MQPPTERRLRLRPSAVLAALLLALAAGALMMTNREGAGGGASTAPVPAVLANAAVDAAGTGGQEAVPSPGGGGAGAGGDDGDDDTDGVTGDDAGTGGADDGSEGEAGGNDDGENEDGDDGSGALPDDAAEGDADAADAAAPATAASALEAAEVTPIAQCGGTTMRTLPRVLTDAYASHAAGLSLNASTAAAGGSNAVAAICARLAAQRPFDPFAHIDGEEPACTGGRARYLLMHTAAEGLSKWSHGVLEAVYLAKRLNRIFVEPCVRGGRIVACAPGLVIPVPSGEADYPAADLLAGTGLDAACGNVAGDADPLRVAAYEEACGLAPGVEPSRRRAYPLRLYFNIGSLRRHTYDRIISFDEWTRRELCSCTAANGLKPEAVVVADGEQAVGVPPSPKPGAGPATHTPTATPSPAPGTVPAVTLAATLSEGICLHSSRKGCFAPESVQVKFPLSFRREWDLKAYADEHHDDWAAWVHKRDSAIAAGKPLPGADDESCYETDGAQEWMLPVLARSKARNLAFVDWWRHSFVFPGRCDAMPPFNSLHQRAVDAWLRRRFGNGVSHHFAAFQWRTETVPHERLPACATRLQAKMQEVRWAMAAAAAAAVGKATGQRPASPLAPAPAVFIADLPSETNPCKMWTVYAGSNGGNDNRISTLAAMMPPGVEKYDGWLPGVDAGVLSIRDLILGRTAQVYVTGVRLRSKLTDSKQDEAICHGCFYCASGFTGAVARSRAATGKLTVTRWLDVNASTVAVNLMQDDEEAVAKAGVGVVAPTPARTPSPSPAGPALPLPAPTVLPWQANADAQLVARFCAAALTAAGGGATCAAAKEARAPPSLATLPQELTAAYDALTASRGVAEAQPPPEAGGASYATPPEALCARLAAARRSDPLAGSSWGGKKACGAARYVWLHSTHERDGDDVTRWGGSVLEALHLAKRLRRTFVEPCVRGGRIVPCAPGLVLPVPLGEAGAQAALGGDSLLGGIAGNVTGDADPARVGAFAEDCAPGASAQLHGHRAYPLRLYFDMASLRDTVYDRIISFDEWSRRELCECAGDEAGGGNGLVVKGASIPVGGSGGGDAGAPSRRLPTLSAQLSLAIDLGHDAGAPPADDGGSGSGGSSHPIRFRNVNSVTTPNILAKVKMRPPADSGGARQLLRAASVVAESSSVPPAAAATSLAALLQEEDAAVEAAAAAGAAGSRLDRGGRGLAAIPYASVDPCFDTGGSLAWFEAWLEARGNFRTLTLTRYPRYAFGADSSACAPRQWPPVAPLQAAAAAAWLRSLLLPSAAPPAAKLPPFTALHWHTAGLPRAAWPALASQCSPQLAARIPATAGVAAVVLTSDLRSPNDGCYRLQAPAAGGGGLVDAAPAAAAVAALTSAAAASQPAAAIHHLPDWLPGVDAGVRQLRQLVVATAARTWVTGTAGACFGAGSPFAALTSALRDDAGTDSVADWLAANVTTTATAA